MSEIFLKTLSSLVILVASSVSVALAMPVPCEIDLVTGGCTNQPPIVNFTTGEGPSLSSHEDGYLLQIDWLSSLYGGTSVFRDLYFKNGGIEIFHFNGVEYSLWKISFNPNTGKPIVSKGELPIIGGPPEEIRKNFPQKK